MRHARTSTIRGATPDTTATLGKVVRCALTLGVTHVTLVLVQPTALTCGVTPEALMVLACAPIHGATLGSPVRTEKLLRGDVTHGAT